MKKTIFLAIITGLCTAAAAQPPGRPEREVVDSPVIRRRPPPPAPAIREGGVYSEAGSTKIYAIQNGRKLLVPTIAALWAMGYQQQQIVTVAAGRLNPYPAVIIRSKSLTPGSLLFPPEGNHIPLRGLNGATRVYSRGKEIQLIELRGWLRDISGGCNEDAPRTYQCPNKGRDMHYGFELDMDWAEQAGIDVHKLLRVGNIAVGWGNHGGVLHPDVSSSHAKLMGPPMIPVELNSWGWICRFPGGAPPADWVSNVMQDCPNIIWPFPPHATEPNGNTWQRGFEVDTRGPYVVMVGSVLTDDPHDNMGDVLYRWGSNPKNEHHPGRWTEMHPPDTIGVLPFQPARVMTRGIAISALPNQTERLEFDLFPERDGIPKPAPNAVVNFSESTGPESFFPRGRNGSNGITITKFADHIHVVASIQGSTDIFGSSGRLKSIIQVWWQVPAPPPQPAAITGTWAGTWGNGSNNGPNFYSFQLDANGSMRLLDINGNIIASGTYTFANRQFNGRYRYQNGGGEFSAAGVLDASGTLGGTWGSGSNATGGGMWTMRKTP